MGGRTITEKSERCYHDRTETQHIRCRHCRGGPRPRPRGQARARRPVWAWPEPPSPRTWPTSLIKARVGGSEEANVCCPLRRRTWENLSLARTKKNHFETPTPSFSYTLTIFFSPARMKKNRLPAFDNRRLEGKTFWERISIRYHFCSTKWDLQKSVLTKAAFFALHFCFLLHPSCFIDREGSGKKRASEISQEKGTGKGLDRESRDRLGLLRKVSVAAEEGKRLLVETPGDDKVDSGS